ncbi:MAG: flagellar filament capping protein FliD [Terriglobales bacterium]|jgi:flagellar hook-associated protein 2
MSTSGINLSSLLSALGSSSSGIDVSSAVAAAISALSTPELQWESQQQTLQTQTSAINQIQTDVGALETSLTALTDPAGALASMTTTSSDANVVTASAAPGTTAGSHVIVVNNIATTASWYSDSVASSSAPLASGSFTLTVGSGTATQIPIGGSVDTLDQLAASINGQNLGVTASVVNDSSGARLAIASNSSGSAAGFTISNASGLTFTEASAGADASLTVDGIPIDSASNTVSGAVSGLTLNLLSASPGGQVTVSVAPDSASAEKAIASFVGAYNTAIGDVNAQYTVNTSNQEGPLAGDSTVRMLQDALLAAGSYSGGGNGVSTLGDLGITMNKDGTLTLDTATLANAVQNSFSAVQSFMQGASSNGFASTLNNQLNALTDSASGAFTVDLQSITSENTDLQQQINTFQTYINNQRTLLTAEYNQADIALQEIPQEQAQINAELGYSPTTKSS